MRTEALRRARPGDPFVEWHIDPSGIEAAVIDGDHVAWSRLSRNGSERWATALGDDAGRVAALLGRLDEQARIDGVTVQASVHRDLPSPLQAPETGHWSLWIIGANDVTERMREFATAAKAIDGADERINGLLRHSESAHIFAGNPAIARWAGVEDGGALVAVAGQEIEASGAAHIVSVCTDPGHRGLGHARAVCSRLVVEAVGSGSPVVILEMYAANEAGRALYSSVGFTEAGQYRSGLLRRALTPEGVLG